LRREGIHRDAAVPDLIFLDLNLPKKNGFAVLGELKQHPQWKRIPVVILTSSSLEADIVRAYDLHANCYVSKPADFDKWVEVVRATTYFWLQIVALPELE
jgi:CheY-like chemotaxis protein